MRKVTKHTPQGDVVVEMMELVEGDTFTLQEPDNVIVGKFKAAGNPYLNKDKIATIMCDYI